MERRLTAILAADVAGYSRHTDAHDEASTATLRAHLAVVRESIDAHKGHIFTIAGDGVVAEFPSVVEAIRCAVKIQSAIAVRNATVPEKERMQFRIGINLGDVISEDNNLYGTGVNVAVRLEQLALPGGICISQTVYDQVRKIVEIPFEDIGERCLKNIADPIRVYRVLPAPLPWYNRLWSHWKIYLRRPKVAALVFLLLFGLAVGALYLREFSDSFKGATVAVLPFRTVIFGGDKEQGYFSDGLAVDIMTELSRSPDLGVLASATAFKYKGKDVDVRDVGRDENVRYVLDGVVRNFGDDFIVNATLSDARTGIAIWSERFHQFHHKMGDFVGDEIVRRIVAKIGGGYGVIERNEATSANRKTPGELQAYDLVLRARGLMQNEWSGDNFIAAKEWLQKAIKLDPSSRRARRELAYLAVMGWVFRYDPPYPQRLAPQEIQEITAQAKQAVGLDPDDPRARMVAASAYFFNKQLDSFDREATKAIELAPNDPEILATLGALIANKGDWKRGVAMVKKANALNAAAAQGWYQSTMYLNYYLNGDYNSALDFIMKNPDFQGRVTYALYDYIAICGQLGRPQYALEKPESRSEGDECKKRTTTPDDEGLSAQEAWRMVLKEEPGASAQTLEDWYRLWNFQDKDITELMKGVDKSGVLEEAKAQPVAQDHQFEPAVER